MKTLYVRVELFHPYEEADCHFSKFCDRA